MNRNRSIALLAGSLLTLAAVLLAWWVWPSGDGSADLTGEPVPVTTTSTPAPATTSPTPSTTTTTPPPPAVEPVRLRIPSLGVDAAVVPVGIEADGDMELPPAAAVGWYRLGPRPGDPGSAVLAGHVDLNDERGAFFDLRSLEVGAEVVVVGDGTSRRYVVTGREQLPKEQVDLSRYFTHQGPNRITLITCGGVFDRGAGHYQDNIIVTAEPG
jgi:sortase (surface protein transpeptidase)